MQWREVATHGEPQTKLKKPGEGMPTPRYEHSAVSFLPLIVLHGGVDRQGHDLLDTVVLDITTAKWELLPTAVAGGRHWAAQLDASHGLYWFPTAPTARMLGIGAPPPPPIPPAPPSLATELRVIFDEALILHLTLVL